VILVEGGVRSAIFEHALFLKVTLIDSFALARRQEPLLDRGSDRAPNTANSNYNLREVGGYSKCFVRGKFRWLQSYIPQVVKSFTFFILIFEDELCM
jgi:hypothetical protein